MSGILFWDTVYTRIWTGNKISLLRLSAFNSKMWIEHRTTTVYGRYRSQAVWFNLVPVQCIIGLRVSSIIFLAVRNRRVTTRVKIIFMLFWFCRTFWSLLGRSPIESRPASITTLASFTRYRRIHSYRAHCTCHQMIGQAYNHKK